MRVLLLLILLGLTTAQTVGDTTFYSGEYKGYSQKIGETTFYNVERSNE